jgi:hypothetical protein
MHFAVRALLLFIGGILAFAISIFLGMAWELWEFKTLLNRNMFWDRMHLLSGFQVVFVASMLSMLLPTSYYGANVLSDFKYKHNGWGDNPGFGIFFATCFVTFPLMIVFLPPNYEVNPALMSRSVSILPYLALWWAHGGINVYHVHLVSKPVTDET